MRAHAPSQLLQYTPGDSAEHARLEEAIAACVRVVAQVDRHFKLSQLQHVVGDAAVVSVDDELLFERKARCKDDRDVTVHVLPQLVVVTRLKRGKESLLAKPIPIDNVYLDDLDGEQSDEQVLVKNMEHGSKKAKTLGRSGSFRLSRRGSMFGRSSFVLKFNFPDDKRAFISTVHEVQDARATPKSEAQAAVV